MVDSDDAKKERNEMYDGNHQAKFSHELVTGGVAFEAMRKGEDSQRKKGKSPWPPPTIFPAST